MPSACRPTAQPLPPSCPAWPSCPARTGNGVGGGDGGQAAAAVLVARVPQAPVGDALQAVHHQALRAKGGPVGGTEGQEWQYGNGSQGACEGRRRRGLAPRPQRRRGLAPRPQRRRGLAPRPQRRPPVPACHSPSAACISAAASPASTSRNPPSRASQPGAPGQEGGGVGGAGGACHRRLPLVRQPRQQQVQQRAAAVLGRLPAGVEQQELQGGTGAGDRKSRIRERTAGKCSIAARPTAQQLHSMPASCAPAPHLRELGAVREQHAALKGGQQRVPGGRAVPRCRPPLQVPKRQLHHAVKLVGRLVHRWRLRAAALAAARRRRRGRCGNDGWWTDRHAVRPDGSRSKHSRCARRCGCRALCRAGSAASSKTSAAGTPRGRAAHPAA